MNANDDSGPITESRDVNTDEYRIRKLEVSGAVMAEKIKNLEESIDRLTTAVDNLTNTMTQAKGGWKVLVLQGGLIAAVVTLTIQLAEFFKGG